MSTNKPSGEPHSVSIALAAYNGQSFIAEQIESILRQDYPVHEIIICDDNSSDGTLEVLKQFDSSKIKVFSNDENLGYVKNFERVCSLCSGDYIALCDQDDIWIENKISVLMKKILENDSMAAFSDAVLIDESGIAYELGLWDAVLKGERMPKKLDFRSFYLSNCVTGCTFLLKKELLDYAVPFSTSLPHDWWLAYHAAYQGSLTFSTEKLVHYRQHGANIIGVLHNVKKSAGPAAYLKKKLKKLSLRDRLQRYSKWHDDVEKRLRAYWDFESAAGRRPTEELTLLYEWITYKIGNKDISRFDEFFINAAGSAAFTFIGPKTLLRSRFKAETYEEGVRRITWRYFKKVLLAVLVLLLVSLIAPSLF